jgi:hypothetical protein
VAVATSDVSAGAGVTGVASAVWGKAVAACVTALTPPVTVGGDVASSAGAIDAAPAVREASTSLCGSRAMACGSGVMAPGTLCSAREDTDVVVAVSAGSVTVAPVGRLARGAALAACVMASAALVTGWLGGGGASAMVVCAAGRAGAAPAVTGIATGIVAGFLGKRMAASIVGSAARCPGAAGAELSVATIAGALGAAPVRSTVCGAVVADCDAALLAPTTGCRSADDADLAVAVGGDGAVPVLTGVVRGFGAEGLTGCAVASAARCQAGGDARAAVAGRLAAAPPVSTVVIGVCGAALAPGAGTEGAVALAWIGLGAPLTSRWRTAGAASSGVVFIAAETFGGTVSAAALAEGAVVVGVASFGPDGAVAAAGTVICPRVAAPNGEAPTSAVSTSPKLAAPRAGAACTESGDAVAMGPKDGAVRTGMRALIGGCRERRRRMGCKTGASFARLPRPAGCRRWRQKLPGTTCRSGRTGRRGTAIFAGFSAGYGRRPPIFPLARFVNKPQRRGTVCAGAPSHEFRT